MTKRRNKKLKSSLPKVEQTDFSVPPVPSQSVPNLPEVETIDSDDTVSEDEKLNHVIQELENSKLAEGGVEEKVWEDVHEDEVRSCEVCCLLETDLPGPMKHCAKCQWAYYCSRECQKVDWGEHKLQCGGTKQKPNLPSDPLSSYKAAVNVSEDNRLPTSLEDIIALFSTSSGIPTSAFTTTSPSPSSFSSMLDSPDSLENLPQRQAFSLLIDAYRLRTEDEYTFRGDAVGLHAGRNPLPLFKRFLDRAEKRGGVLPSWWTKESRKNCERQAGKESEFSCIHHAMEKSDIQEHYGDPLMPMKLRLLAERVIGSGVGGFR